MRIRFPVFIAALALAAGLAGCASPPPPSHAKQASDNQKLSELAQRLHSPKLMAQVLLKQARESKDPEKATQAAVLAFKAGDDALAGEAADLMEKLEPGSPLPAVIRLRLALDKGDIDSALHSAQTLYAAGGANALYQISRNGNYDDWYIYALVSRLSAAHPDDAELTQLLAQAALGAGDNGAALAAARKAVAGGLDDLMMQVVQMQAEWGLGKRKAAVARGAKVLASNSHDVAFRALFAGLLTRSGDYARARSVLDDGAALDPGNIHIELAYALLEQAQGKDQAAHQRLTRLLERGSTSATLYYLLGDSAAGQGEWSQAFVWYASAGGDSSAQVAAADALYHWKGLDEARSFLHKQMQHQPGLAPLWVATEAGLLDGAGETAQAYALLDDAAHRYPMVRPLRYQQALLADKLGKSAVAISLLEALVKAEPGNPEYLNAYGYVLTVDTRRYKEGYGYIQRALAAYPDDPAILDSMGWVLYKLGKPKQAVDYLERAHEGAADATVSVHLATVYLALGRKAEAGKVVKAALAKAPGNADLKRLQQRLTQ